MGNLVSNVKADPVNVPLPEPVAAKILKISDHTRMVGV